MSAHILHEFLKNHKGEIVSVIDLLGYALQSIQNE